MMEFQIKKPKPRASDFRERETDMTEIPILRAGDRLRLRKKHPCGGDTVVLLRVGAEIRMRCETCGHDTVMDRLKFEKAIRQRMPGGKEGTNA